MGYIIWPLNLSDHHNVSILGVQMNVFFTVLKLNLNGNYVTNIDENTN